MTWETPTQLHWDQLEPGMIILYIEPAKTGGIGYHTTCRVVSKDDSLILEKARANRVVAISQETYSLFGPKLAVQGFYALPQYLQEKASFHTDPRQISQIAIPRPPTEPTS